MTIDTLSARWWRMLALGILLMGMTLTATARDQLRIGIQLEPQSMDPTQTAAASTGEITYCNVLEGLTVMDGQGRLRPRLATSWTLSDDGLRYEFLLRSGVRFHDGRVFDAAVAAYSLEQMLKPGSKNPQRQWFEKVVAVKAVGANKLVVQLSQPDALLPFALAQPAAVMVHPNTAAGNATHPMGTGPFRFGEWNPGHWVQLERHDGYWGKAPALRTARFLFMHTTAETENMLAEGLVDGLVSVTKLTDQFKVRPDYRMSQRQLESKMILAINNARPPFNDLRVRRALAHAIDRETFSQLYGPDLPARLIGSHFPPTHPAHVDLVQRYPYDPTKARALLDQARVPKKTKVVLTIPPTDYGRYGGLLIAKDLEAVGFRVELAPVEWKSWLSDVFVKKDYALTLILHVEPMDLNIYARDDYYFNYDNAAFKKIWQQVLAARSETELNRWLGAAQRQVTEDAANVFLFMRPERNLMHRDLTGLWEKSPIPSFVLEDIRWSR